MGVYIRCCVRRTFTPLAEKDCIEDHATERTRQKAYPVAGFKLAELKADCTDIESGQRVVLDYLCSEGSKSSFTTTVDSVSAGE
jgi:hypothetical protein